MTTVEEANAITSARADDPAGEAPGGSFTTGVFGIAAVGVALLSAAVTFAVLAGLLPSMTEQVLYGLLIANGVIVLPFLLMLGRDVWQIIQARRRGQAGSRLHIQMIALFSIIAVVPVLLVAVAASVTLDGMLDRFFNSRNRLMLENSVNLAQLYLTDQQAQLGRDITALAVDIGWLKPYFEQDRPRFKQELGARGAALKLSAVILLDKDAKVVEAVDIGDLKQIDLPPPSVLADVGEAAAKSWVATDFAHVGSVIKLRLYSDTYLMGVRLLNSEVAPHLRDLRVDLLAYGALEQNRVRTQILFASMHAEIALAILLSAVWLGFNFANRLVTPIRRLIAAANAVSAGNLFVQVPVDNSKGDLAKLGSTFNRMTQDLLTQRDDLVRARDLIDSRRLFTEAVLAGASAGVIGVDADGHISILNRSAEKLIGCSESEALGRSITQQVPELAALVGSASTGYQRLIHGQVSITREGRERTVSVRVTTEQSPDPRHGYVVTLDDITELVAAQRTSAWADVARRIAHEIKNPLTPIQLSAERLRRKYGSVITEDKAVFEQCTNTIVRQVDDIRRMVDEFSRFARMPKPVIAAEDVADTVRQVIFLMRVGNNDIDFDVNITEDPMPAQFDRRLISQALTNIIKNATEAIAAVPPAELGRGHIKVSTQRDNGVVNIDVVDNGIGLPRENRNRLLEPYVTTREKGTGLGLAIVGKILEDHGGAIELHDASEKEPGTRGTWVRLLFAAEGAPAEATPGQALRGVAS